MVFLLANKLENHNHVIWLTRFFPALTNGYARLLISDWLTTILPALFSSETLDNIKDGANSGS